jgi:hypothetical protein
MADYKSVEQWGRDKAKARYTGGRDTLGKNVEHQKPQMPEDKQDAKYDNDTPSDWLRGMGKSEAEGKPSFDHHKGKR